MTTEILTPNPEFIYPYLRDEPTRTLADYADTFDSHPEAIRVESGSDIHVDDDLTVISLNNVEIPCTTDSLAQVAKWAGFPGSFYDGLDNDFKSQWLSAKLERIHTPGIVRVGERSGIMSILAPGQTPVFPADIVRVARNVLGDEAKVVDCGLTPRMFHLDTVTYEGNLGDPHVGDITKAGLRFSQNIGQNLAPTVEPYSYRLWCTNGASHRVVGKLDARGQSVDDVLAELEAMAELAFSSVERDVQALYDLRNERVDNPERALARIAREDDLSDRLRMRAIDALPGLVPDIDNITMFDMINAVQHMANSPQVRTRGARLELEGFGVRTRADHAARCHSCQSRLV